MVCAAQAFLPSPRGAAHAPGLGWRLLRAGLLVSVATTCLAIVLRASLVVLANVAPVSEAAHYSVAYRFAEIAFMVAQVLGIALLPAMSARSAADRAEGRRFALRLLVLGTGAVALAAPLLAWVTPDVLVAVFGQGYAPAGPAARALVWMLPVFVSLSLAWNALIADRREVPLVASGLLGVAAAAGGAVWIAGAPVALTAAESVIVAFGAMALVCVGALLAGPRAHRLEAARVPLGASEAA